MVAHGAPEALSAPVRHMRQWLKARMTGCWFASRLATHDLISWGEQPGKRADADTVTKHVEGAIAEKKVAAMVFPSLSDADGIALLLATLGAHKDWSLSRIRTGFEVASVSFDLRYRSAHGLASVAGFAPIHTMPITRRAPCTALMLWAGPQSYSHLQSPNGEIGLVDAPLNLSKEQHEDLHTKTKDSSRPLFSEPPPSFRTLRPILSMSVCLPDDVVSAHLSRW